MRELVELAVAAAYKGRNSSAIDQDAKQRLFGTKEEPSCIYTETRAFVFSQTGVLFPSQYKSHRFDVGYIDRVEFDEQGNPYFVIMTTERNAAAIQNLKTPVIVCSGRIMTDYENNKYLGQYCFDLFEYETYLDIEKKKMAKRLERSVFPKGSVGLTSTVGDLTKAEDKTEETNDTTSPAEQATNIVEKNGYVENQVSEESFKEDQKEKAKQELNSLFVAGKAFNI